jgi:hypothetical protein
MSLKTVSRPVVAVGLDDGSVLKLERPMSFYEALVARKQHQKP